MKLSDNPLTAQLLDLITLMPDSQTQEILDYIVGLREARRGTMSVERYAYANLLLRIESFRSLLVQSGEDRVHVSRILKTFNDIFMERE